ncbi:sn-1-specific diacylglycerol lipase ABHD11 [Nomia melanderi]|uniref:sn-1-specific diacylglycerol lipase ABHD11 n=1 Tax=Nomia melanderi TaxID=2448451 RepID=UPI0013045541|nr:protein ABHD11-like [Nomia melanderi]
MRIISFRYLIITRNVFIQHWRQDFISTSSLSCNHIHKNSNSVMPVKLAYASYESMKEEASKHPIIIMHGLFGSKNNWNMLSKSIHQQTDRKVITVDARNHGDSPHSSDMTYKHMAKDIVQLMNDLGFEKSILLGHSMGGSTMMYVALHYPELVEKLVVVDMSPVRTSPQLKEMEKIFHAMRSVNLNGNPTLTKTRRMAEEQLMDTIKSVSLCQFLIMNIVEADVGKYKWRINLPVLEQNFLTQIAVFPYVKSKVYKGPTLFVGGGLSDYIKVEDHNKIKQLFPSGKFIYINGANHWVHADKPTEFVNTVVNFINQH